MEYQNNSKETKQNNSRKLENTIFADNAFQYIMFFFLIIALINRLQGVVVILISVLIFVNSSRIWSKFAKKQVDYNFNAESKKMFPNEEISLTINIDNEYENNLLWYQKVKWNLQVKNMQRGWYLLKPSILKIGDPFGFYEEKFDSKNKAIEIIVFPSIFAFEMPTIFKKEIMGNTYKKNGLIKDPIFFAGIREYQQRQPARFINWKATARYNSIQETVFDSSTQLKIIFLLDVRYFENSKALFEKVLSTIASLAYKLDRAGFSYGIISNGKLAGKKEKDYINYIPKNNNSNLKKLLEILARTKIEYEYELDKIMQSNQVPNDSSLLYFSYEHFEDMNINKVLIDNKKHSMVNIICNPENNKIDRNNLLKLEQLVPEKYNKKINKEGVL